MPAGGADVEVYLHNFKLLGCKSVSCAGSSTILLPLLNLGHFLPWWS